MEWGYPIADMSSSTATSIFVEPAGIQQQTRKNNNAIATDMSTSAPLVRSVRNRIENISPGYIVNVPLRQLHTWHKSYPIEGEGK